MTLQSFLVLFSLALSVALGLVLAQGRGPAGGSKRGRPRIELSLDTLKEARWQGDRDALVERASALGAEVVRIGVKQATYLVDSLPHAPAHPLRIVRILGAPTDYNVHQVKQGQDSVLAPDSQPEAAKRIVNAAITQHEHGRAAERDDADGGVARE